MLHRHLTQNSKIHLTVDADVDGYTSSAIIYNFIKRVAPTINILYYLHPGKEHGISLEDLDYSCDLYIVPDAGSNQKKELEKLASMGKDILVLDHHEVDVDIQNEHIVIINNQTSKLFTNKALSGAGVTFKFIQAYSECYGGAWEDYYDLAALGIISDMMYSGTLDNNSIIERGLAHIKNRFFQALLEKQDYSITSKNHPNKIDIAFYITPVINGVIRIGTQEEKTFLFEAMANNDKTEEITTEYRKQDRVEDYYTYVARTSVNIKSRQDALINTITSKIFQTIEEKELDKNQIIIYQTALDNPNEVPQVLTGLVAMKIAAKYNKPTLVVRPILINGIQYYAGSGRGRRAEGFNSLREFCLESGYFDLAAGHAFAHGVRLKESNIVPFVRYANKKLKDINFGNSTIEVCGINPPYPALTDFALHNRLYGNGIPQPAFAFVFSCDEHTYRIMGSRQDTIKFTNQGIDFIQFHAKETINLLNEIQGLKTITLVGRPQMNEFRGVQNLQIVIDDIMVDKYELL